MGRFAVGTRVTVDAQSHELHTSSGVVDGVPIFGSYRTYSVSGFGCVAYGCVCKKCNAKNEYAEPNEPDGSYVCYDCR